MDEEKVQDISSGETQIETQPITDPQTPAAEKPFTRADAEAMMSTLTERVAKAEGLSRQFQSAKDKAIADNLRLRREMELERKVLQQGSQELDEDSRNHLELTAFRTRYAYQKQQEQEEEMAKQEEAVVNDFYDSTQAYLSEVGIDHNDKRIEWGDRTENLATKHKRIMSQVGKIHKETLQKERDSAKQWAKEETAKMRKELGLDSVDTSVATGTGEFAGIPTKASELGKWIGKMSQQDYETKYADKIKEMRRRGLIT